MNTQEIIITIIDKETFFEAINSKVSKNIAIDNFENEKRLIVLIDEKIGAFLKREEFIAICNVSITYNFIFKLIIEIEKNKIRFSNKYTDVKKYFRESKIDIPIKESIK